MSGYGGIVTRTLALATDALVLNVGLAVTTTIIGLALSVFGADLSDIDTSGLLAGLGAWCLVTAAYFVAFWTLTEQTPGMRVLRLKVVSIEGERLRFGRAVLRFIGMILAALPLMAGYLPILWDPRRQGLHDKIARSVVRYVPPPESTTLAVTAVPSRSAGARLG